MLCHRCGSHVPDGAETCQNCGAALSGNSSRPERPNSLVLRRRRRQQNHSNLPYSVGSLIDERFEVREVLGSGALGAVFKVYDQDLDMDVALKIIQSNFLTDPDTISNLRLAARRVRKLNHPNIAKLYDEGVENDLFYYTMQNLEGLTLRKIINLRKDKQQPFTLQEVEPIFFQIAEALEYAHTTTYHGNLKPQNIIVLPDLLKLTDFGVVQALPFSKLLAAQKKQPAALAYIAPEVTQGQESDGRADIYSLGIIFGEMLTCESDPDAFTSICDLNDEAHPLLDDIYRKATEFNPRERYQHVSDFLADITSVLEYGELSEDEEVPTVIVDAELDMAYTGSGMALDDDPSAQSELSVHHMDLDGSQDTAAAQLDGSVEFSDSMMELSEIGEDDEKTQAGQLTPPPIPLQAATTKPPESSTPTFQFDGESSKFSLPKDDEPTVAGGSPPPLPAKVVKGRNGPPAPPKPVPNGRSAAMPPLPPKKNPITPPALPTSGESADTSSNRLVAPPIPPVQAPIAPPHVPPPAFPHVPQHGSMGTQPPLPPHPMHPTPILHTQPEEPGFSRAGIFFFVLGMFLIFGTGGIGLYFKFVYLPQQDSQKQTQTDPRTTVRPRGATHPVPRVPTRGRPVGTRTSTQKVVTSPRPPAIPVRVSPVPRKVRKTPPPVAVRKRTVKPRPVKRRRVKVAVAVKKKPTCPRGMIRIRKGGFLMGSSVDDKMRNWGEKKLKWTRTQEYCIDRYEYPGGGRRPRTGISFYGAKKACEKIGKRLCSEQEWERACKGSRNIRYPYGNTFDANRCNTRNKSDQNRSVTRSGRFRKCYSPYGAYDMSGNVAEWTSSHYRGRSKNRVVRGGSAKRPDWGTRCASRSSKRPSSSKSTLGFRCCADPKK